MPGQLPDDAPMPRLCLVVKNSPTQEYGYNLHAERGKPQFIGTVDSGSPADRGGLRPGDRIFAVNGHSIIGENHKQVVQRIKEDPLQCELLVISEEGAEWYKRRNISISPSLSNVHNCYTDKQEKVKSNNSDTKRKSSPTMATVLRPRLCKLRKREPSEEFGFNLHAEEKRGHFVGAVDKDGIGERAGLEMGQRIVGVNGQIIYPTTFHKKVVSLIKMNPLRTDLLVASEEVDNWFTENHMVYSFDNAEIYNSENELRPEDQLNEMENEQSEIHQTDDGSCGGDEMNKRKHSATNVDVDPEKMVDSVDENFADMNIAHSHVVVDELKVAHELNHGQSTVLHETPAENHTENNSSAHSVTKITASVAPLKQTDAPFIPYDEKNFGNNNESKERHADMDIFMLSADEARNRLVKGKKDPRRDLHMSLQEKYQMVSNM